MRKIELPEDYAIVLYLVKQRGKESFTSLAETVRFDRARLAHIIQNLQHKGLIMAGRSVYSDNWIRLSAKGQRLMRAMRPEFSVAAFAT
jgi:DNA-binding MarR family transcriptional regulator